MDKWLKKGMAATVAGTMVFGLAACGSKGNGGSADGHLVFQIWDQGPGGTEGGHGSHGRSLHKRA